ncbi:hypothetical protein AK812_SmicGene1151 [Symbiodinium microadriaticum]|uniref:Uncharacterized protein n=1 Tax=Symbiodinium microadriaticum TaxID=2951 RepID=A0A1Q9F4X9_SYMMI|nr:hypothetical protein AK812_SmicGene1151 [Symbiodinium microadriaticum]
MADQACYRPQQLTSRKAAEKEGARTWVPRPTFNGGVHEQNLDKLLALIAANPDKFVKFVESQRDDTLCAQTSAEEEDPLVAPMSSTEFMEQTCDGNGEGMDSSSATTAEGDTIRHCISLVVQL